MTRYVGGFITKSPVLPTPGAAKGIWTLDEALQYIKAGTWPQPGPVNFLYSWGENPSGALGLNNTINRSSPNQVGNKVDWLQVAAGGYLNNSAAIKTNNTLWTWGNNGSGQLGIGNTANRSSPVQVGALTTWLQVSSGRYAQTAAIKTDGTLWIWGNNVYGTLGLNNTVNYSSPKQVGAGTNWSKVQVGNARIIAIKTDGTLWGWGYGSSGAIGVGTTVTYSSPVQVGALTTWSKISGVGNTSYAIKTDGTLWAWGANLSGQLGDNTTTYKSSPIQIGSLTTWSEISGGMYFAFAKKTDGTIWTWGSNDSGQIGDNTVANRSSPVQVGALTTWLSICATYYSSYAIKTDGTLWSWGSNISYGQLGLNDTANRSSPVQIGSLTTWNKLSEYGGNARHMLVLSSS